MTGQADYTIWQAAYDLRKLRGKGLAVKPGRILRQGVCDLGIQRGPAAA